MPLTPSGKIAVGWVCLISAGLSGFVFARDSVVKNRKALMETRKRIREQAQREGEYQFEQREAKKKNSEMATQ